MLLANSFMKDSLSSMGLLADDFFLYRPQTADLDDLSDTILEPPGREENSCTDFHQSIISCFIL